MRDEVARAAAEIQQGCIRSNCCREAMARMVLINSLF
jgi:hypothetical protein